MATAPVFRFVDNRGRARLAVAGLGLGVLAVLATAGWLLWLLLAWGQLGDVDAFTRFGAMLDGFTLVALAVGAVFFIRWFRREYENAMALGMRSSCDPGWALVAWFVPIVNFIEPATLTNRMWDHAGTQRVGNSMLAGMWWFCWIVPNLVTKVVSPQLTGQNSAETVQGMLQILLGCYLVTAFSGVLGIMVVRRLTRAHEEMQPLHGVEAVFGDAPAQSGSAPGVVSSSSPGERLVEGAPCGSCGGTIVSHVDASVCQACDLPFHDSCLSEGACPHCRTRDLDPGFRFY